ncbi:MAG: hypothetical protein U0794_06400 [Isosphaeraceae bacterium]
MKNVATLTGHAGPVQTVAISADGTRVVTGSVDKAVKVWTPRRRRASGPLGHARITNRGVSILPDNKTVLGRG